MVQRSYYWSGLTHGNGVKWQVIQCSNLCFPEDLGRITGTSDDHTRVGGKRLREKEAPRNQYIMASLSSLVEL